MIFPYVQLRAAEELSLVALNDSRPEKSGSVYRRQLKAVFEESKSGASMIWSPPDYVGRQKL